MAKTTSLQQQWTQPTRDELRALGIAEEELGYAMELWDGLTNAYIDSLMGGSSGFSALEQISPVAAMSLVESMGDLYGGNAWSLPPIMQKYLEKQEELGTSYTGRFRQLQESLKLPGGVTDMPSSVTKDISSLTASATERTMRELGKFRGEALDERKRAYGKALGPGYETSTPYEQATSLFEREFQPAAANALNTINEQEAQNLLNARQFYSNQNINRLTASGQLESAGAAARGGTTQDIINTYLQGMGLKNQRTALAGDMYGGMLSGANMFQGGLGNLMNMGMLPYNAYSNLAQMYSPFGVQESWGVNRGGGGGSNMWGDLAKSFAGGALSAAGRAIGGPVGGAIGSTVGGVIKGS